MTNALLIVVTLLGINALLSLLSVRSQSVDRLLNDVPLVLIEEGQIHHDRMRKSRVSEDDILEQSPTRTFVLSVHLVVSLSCQTTRCR